MDKNKKEIKKSLSFSEVEKRQIIEEYLNSDSTKDAIWIKYTGYCEDHGGLLRWMRKLGYIDKPKKVYKLAVEPEINKILIEKEEDLEPLAELTPQQYEQKIKLLEKQLFESQLLTEAYLLTIEIAEKELKIPILKKPNTK